MRDLGELLSGDDGRALLRSRGVYTDPVDFVAAITPPPDPSLNSLLARPADALVVYIGQQPCADYQAPVVAKFQVADLLRGFHVGSVMLWHDLDRAGSERFGMRILLPTSNGHPPRGVYLADRSLGDREMRFIPVDHDRLHRFFAQVSARVAPGVRPRVATLAEAVMSRPIDSLAGANRALAEGLLGARLRLEVPSAFVSALIQPTLTRSVNAYLAALDDVVSVFNEAVETLLALDIDPRLHLLDDDYLPLFYSCHLCHTRVRLVHECSGADHFAAAVCRCGVSHRFHLGSSTVSLGELEATGRWSPDVSLPVHLNEVASGSVVGRSAAMYGMVLNEVIERALGARPIPALVPPALADRCNGDQPTLLMEYLTA